ncbi:hypothetical protein [Noviherbaspirillum pedocola]|uniref:Uncharacterized protein n=1 Tax=Noviherbaspirillum pedocola TaxID=2801341 RepID=A0A934W7L6_9BURK|nr:hypothetical protein [Noviherbaspirillum pedocola]MBK4735733.1 hypothetical protein [Noviherbaspirillum pedocola]
MRRLANVTFPVADPLGVVAVFQRGDSFPEVASDEEGWGPWLLLRGEAGATMPGLASGVFRVGTWPWPEEEGNAC